MLKKKVDYTLVAYIAIAFLAGGLLTFLALNTLMPKSKSDKTNRETFFDSENAYVMGTIVDFSQDSIKIKNAKDATRTFKLGSDFFVSKPGDNNSPIATGSGQLNLLEKDKQASLVIIKVNGDYEVKSVIYMAMPPSLPKSPPLINSGAAPAQAAPSAVVTPLPLPKSTK